ncbi:MAG: SdrD B-like domain-containing protein, partial [Saprospiraceae bacterium]
GIGGVNIRLWNDINPMDGIPDAVPTTPVRSVFTTAAGLYSMTNLVPGQYVLVETQPAGYSTLYESDESNDNDTLVVSPPNDEIIPVTIEPQENDADNIFREHPTSGLITGYVFNDLNLDGIPDTGEGIGGVTINLWKDVNLDGVADPGGFVTSTLSAGTGFYSIGNITPGSSYIIAEVQPAGFLSVSDIDATNDNDLVPNTNMNNDTIPATIINGETDANNYFIEAQACTHIVTNTNDNGPGSLRYIIDCANSGDTIHFANALTGQAIHLNTGRIEIYKDIHIYCELSPRVMIYSDVPGAFMIGAGHTVELKNLDITTGLGGMSGAAFEIAGSLILWDIWLYRNPLLPPNNIFIYNQLTGNLEVKGLCHIQTN